MLKVKILSSTIAIICLFLTISVFADVVKNDLNPITKFNPDHERFDDISEAGPAQPSFKKPVSAFRQIESGYSIAGPPLDYFCDYEDYTNGTAYYIWSIPDSYGDDLFNMRFTSVNNYNCTLITAHLLFYALPQTGDPDVRIYLWDDDGFGFPGNKIDSIDILDPGAGLEGTNTLYWVTADFSSGTYVFSDGEEYHIGFTVIQNTPGDTLLLVSDDGTGPFSGEERASEYYGSNWGTMLNDWGTDVSFFIIAERCCSEIPYSDCHSISYIQNISYYWKTPNPTYGDSAYAQRFSFNGYDTLVSVDFAVYDDAGLPGATGIFGNNDIYISVYDDLYGIPNNLIASETIPAGTYAAYPAITTVYFGDLVLPDGDYHITFSTNAVFGSGEYECILSSDGTDGVGRSSSVNGNIWQSMFVSWGMDVNFYIKPYICEDPTDCELKYCYNGLGYLWRLPDQYGDVGQAQKFSTDFYSEDCHIREVAIMFYWSGTSGLPTQYTYNTEISINAGVAGVPGPAIATITLTPADYMSWGLTGPGVGGVWIVLDFEDMAYVAGDYWVTVNSLAPTPETGIRLVSDAGGGPCIDSWAEDWGGGNWHLMTDGWGVENDWAMVMEVEECCVNWTPPPCPNPTDWSTLQGNYGRTGTTQITMSDSWCDLNLKWSFQSFGEMITYTGPVTYDERVACSFTDKYRVFDFDGNLLYTYIPKAGPFDAGDIRCAPTITEISGYPDPVMFVSGGVNQEVHAVDFNTGSLIWSRDINSVGIGGMFGNTRWGVFTILEINGADVVFWGTDDGQIVGVDALTGVLMSGYPVDLTQSTWTSGATDGTSLFYSTRSTAVEGDVYSIDAATGSINWQLSATDGLQGQYIYTHENGYNGDEGFTGGVAYDNSSNGLFLNSRAEANYPTDGLYYSLNAYDGSIRSVSISNRVLYSTPVIDHNRVYMTSFTRWASPPAGGDVFALNKWSGAIDWAVPGGPGAFPFYNSGLLSCEPYPENPVQFYSFTYDGFLQCLSTYDGEELWRRRFDDGPGYINRGMAGALAPDGDLNPYLFFGDLNGNLYCLNKGSDRPRLEIQSYQPSAPVEFGSATNYSVTIDNIFTNTGCEILFVTGVNVDSDSFGIDIPNFTSSRVSSDFMNRASIIADKLAREAYISKYIRPSNINADENIFDVSIESSRGNLNSMAAGFPTFLNSVTYPTAGTVIIPNDTIDIELDVIQANISRGPQSFYLQICTNDPDFFLNEPSLCPELYITLVGGCLVDTSTLYFGVGGVNEHLASNTGRLGTGDWGDGPAGHNGFLIDGDGASYYQGAYAFGVSQYEVACNTQDWTSGGGEVDAMISLQPDPNWCDNDCKPYLNAGVTLGYITSDGGLSYNPIFGNIVCKSFVDSVQNYDLGYGWDWENWGAPFDNALTMGLYVNGRVVGAVDVAELANLTVEILEFTERNGDPIDDWKLWELWDCDNGGDTVAIDKSISSAWAYNPYNGQAWGQIKIPFGCGYDPIVNTVGIYGKSNSFGFFEWNIYWDSAYGYAAQTLGAPPGADPGHYSYNMSNGDGEAMVTLASHNFTGSDSYEIGIAHFGGLFFTDPTVGTELAPLATLVNQWCGFGRGDSNNDGVINLADIIYIAKIVNGGPGAIPFAHLSDVDNDGDTDIDDVQYMVDFYFNNGNCPVGDWVF